MQFNIRNRWNDEVLFTAEITCHKDAPRSFKLGLAVRGALKARVSLKNADLNDANLRNADLSDANLRDTDLCGANLRYANLSDANLRNADLRGADLRDANLRNVNLRNVSLRNANLSGADLSGAYLSRANLSGTDLRDTDLRNANLTEANLTEANLSKANLSEANLIVVRNDLWDVLIRAQKEVPAFLAALRSGKIDGSSYPGKCACLIGTIANIRHANFEDLGNGLVPNSGRPIERWFLAIKEGDTPETSTIAEITETWIVEFLSLMPVMAPGPA